MPSKNNHIKSGYASADGASIYYETSGSGKTVVFIHGLALDGRMWDEQFFEFAKQFHVLRYDLRGFGKSSLPTENYAPHTDLFLLLQHLKINKACLVGLSMGGRIVIDFALAYPECVSSIVMVDAALNGYSFNSFSIEHVVMAAKQNGAQHGNQAWLSHEIFSPALQKPAVAQKLHQIVSSYSGWQWLNRNPSVPIAPPAIRQLDKIICPSLIIVGEKDLPDFHCIADILRDSIKGARKIIIEDAGHMCNMENSAAFNRYLLDFLSEN